MTLILGIETSCDETSAAVYDLGQQQILSNEKKLLASLSEDDIKKLKQMLLTMYNNLE